MELTIENGLKGGMLKKKCAQRIKRNLKFMYMNVTSRENGEKMC